MLIVVRNKDRIILFTESATTLNHAEEIIANYSKTYPIIELLEIKQLKFYIEKEGKYKIYNNIDGEILPV